MELVFVLIVGVIFPSVSGQSYLNHSVNSCPEEFLFDPVHRTCSCPPFINRTAIYFEQEVFCNPVALTYTINHGFWYGVNNFNESERIWASCIYSDCSSDDRVLQNPIDFSDLCREGSNKEGVLCGTCKANHSRAFGTLDCQPGCTNNYIAVILLFGFLGLVLVFLIGFIGITIDKGFIGSVFFFSNLVSVLKLVVHMPLHLKFGFLPTSLLSLELGIPLCFHQNMNSVLATGYELAFLLYLCVLIVVFALITHFFGSVLPRCITPVKIFVTLHVMSYYQLLSICISTLGPVYLNGSDGTYTIRWRMDPAVLYFRGNHAILGTICICILLFYIFPVTALLLCPVQFYKYGSKYQRIVQFLDALYAPYKVKYRFWFGLRTLVLGIVLILSHSISVGIFISVSAMIIVLFSHLQLLVRPFKSNWLMAVEGVLNAIVIVLAIGFIYSNLFLSRLDNGNPLKTAFVHGFLTLFFIFTYTMIFAIVVWHFVERYSILSKCFAFIKRCFTNEWQRGKEVLRSSIRRNLTKRRGRKRRMPTQDSFTVRGHLEQPEARDLENAVCENDIGVELFETNVKYLSPTRHAVFREELLAYS